MKKAIKSIAQAAIFLTAIIACAKFIDNIEIMLIACMAITTIALALWDNKQ